MGAVFDDMMREAAGRLASAMRKAAAAGQEGDVAVFAVYTTAESDGYLYVGLGHPDEPLQRQEFVRPPPSYRQWSSVPYSAQYSALREACARLPILPIDRHPQETP